MVSNEAHENWFYHFHPSCLTFFVIAIFVVPKTNHFIPVMLTMFHINRGNTLSLSDSISLQNHVCISPWSLSSVFIGEILHLANISLVASTSFYAEINATVFTLLIVPICVCDEACIDWAPLLLWWFYPFRVILKYYCSVWVIKYNIICKKKVIMKVKVLTLLTNAYNYV